MEASSTETTGVRRVIREVFGFAVATFILLTILEVALRLFSGESTDVYEHHSVYGMQVNAGISAKFERPPWHGGQSIAWRTNSHGYRGDELSSNPDLRVVVYGDSNIMAMFSELENTFSHRLGQRLSALSGRDVETVNAGTVGFGPDQNVLRLEDEVAGLAPDLIVFHVFADNDYGDLVRNRLFELEGSTISRSGHLVAEDTYLNREPALQLLRLVYRLRRAIDQEMFGSQDGPIVPLEERDMSPRARSETIVANMLAKREAEFSVYQEDLPRRFSYMDDEYDIDIAIEPDSTASQTKVALMKGVISRAHAFAQDSGVPLMVLVQPSVSDLTDLRSIGVSHLSGYPEYDNRRLTGLVEDYCKEEGIPVLNLFDVFEQSNPEHLFFPHDVHWNDEGQDLAAMTAAKFVQEYFSATFDQH